jgi:hypothetical protein
MNHRVEHPPNLAALLDGSPADKEFQEVKQHVESCIQCQEEVRIWESLDDLVRSPELEIDVPPFQWQRIRSRLTESSPKVMGWQRFIALAKPRQVALKSAFAVLLIAVASLSVRQYYNRIGQINQLKTLADFSQSESLRLSEAKNPFSAYAESAVENPFDKFEARISGKNPFAARWQNN